MILCHVDILTAFLHLVENQYFDYYGILIILRKEIIKDNFKLTKR